ncbi:MAG: serine/threonine-protein kinase [Planctomycetota bacterium]|nr:serine/threonine-protein kinase [Planctomycetota bacterium]
MSDGSESTRRHQRVFELFTAAAGLGPRELREYLERECPDDSLRAEVAALLSVERARPPSGPSERLRVSVDVPAASAEEPLPVRIGRYRVLRLVGRGGMGSVYEGEQENPRRRVAIKVVNPGDSVASFLRRFEFEVEVLARLNHPGIAHIIEAGHYDDRGVVQPFFAMEYVEGVPITGYVAGRSLDTAQRLALFGEICDAVHHAHQRGVVHRDLKPANILVDADGHPKILDFGIARITDDKDETTRNTVAGQLLGTIAYMSPEQATGDAYVVDTRSDVYSLGILLYELLTGKLPYEISERRVHAALLTITGADPKPLTVIDPSIDSDLSTIALKAVEKERDRRYPSAAELAADVRRFLSHEPIVARPATTTYVLTKFARRNPLLVTSIVAGVVLVTTALVVALFALASARAARSAETAARARAERETAAVSAMNTFVLRDMIQAVSPVRGGRDMRLVDMLDAAIPRIDETFAEQPFIRDTVRSAIGGTYRELGLLKESERLLRAALPGLEQELGPDDPSVLDVRYQLMQCLDELEDDDGSLALAEHLYQHHSRAYGPRDERTLRMRGDRASMLVKSGQFELGLAESRETLEVSRAAFGPEHPRTSVAMRKLSECLTITGGFAEAEQLIRAYLATVEHTRRAGDPDILSAQALLSRVLLDLGQIPEAETLARAVVDSTTAVYGPLAGRTMDAKGALASLLGDTNRGESATGIYLELYQTSEAMFGRLHARSLFHQGEYAINLRKTGRLEEAERVARAALEGQIELHGEVDPDVAAANEVLSSVLYDKQDLGGADVYLTRALSIARQTIGTKHPRYADMLFNHVALLGRRGEYERAEPVCREMIALDTELRGPRHAFVAAGRNQLAKALVAQGCLEEGAAEFAESIAIHREVVPDGRFREYEALAQMGPVLTTLGRYPEAEAALLEAWNGFWSLNDGRRLARFDLAENLVALYERLGRSAEADVYRAYVGVR